MATITHSCAKCDTEIKHIDRYIYTWQAPHNSHRYQKQYMYYCSKYKILYRITLSKT